MNVRIFTDGACSSNPGPGGYAALITTEKKTKTISGFKENTTNNSMELKAVVEGIKTIMNMIFLEDKKVEKLEIISDSAYVVNAINQNWLKFWKENGFTTKKGETIKNIELWKELDEQLEIMDFINVKILFTKVKGHNGNYFNEMVDKIAKQEIRKNKKVENYGNVL